MDKRFIKMTVLALGLAAGGCEPGSNEPLLARAGDYRLTVGEAVRLLAGQNGLPNDADVVEAVANLWTDYTLLADAVSRDSTFADVDLMPLVQQQLDEIAIRGVQEAVISVDTTTTDEEVSAHYDSASTGLQMRARHILLAYPAQSTAAQRDSVRQATEAIHRRILAGENFETLARQYSQDPGSGAQGGDLGYFGPGDMVPAFEAAVRSTPVGEVSGLVESQYGYHVIRVEERTQPSLEEARPQVIAEIVAGRQREAEAAFVADMDDRANIEYEEDAGELTRRIAERHSSPLGRRAQRRIVARFQGGTLTLGELQDAMQAFQPQLRAQIVDASDEDIEVQILPRLIRRELLVAEAESRDLTPGAPARDSLIALAAERFRTLARSLQFHPLGVAESESRAEAVQNVVMARIEGIVEGAFTVVNVAPVTFVLRKEYRTSILDDGIERTVQRVGTVRPPTSARPPVTPTPSPQPPPTGETTLPAVPDSGRGGG